MPTKSSKKKSSERAPTKKERSFRIPLEKMKDAMLGKKYELSLAYVTPARMHELNLSLRGKDHPTTILSFPFSKTSGEILLCKSVIEKEARDLGKPVTNYANYLVIHGMLHLKGMEHSATMDRSEKHWARIFGVTI